MIEENANMPEGFFDLERLLVDKDIVNPFGEEPGAGEVFTYPYENAQSKGYIRYVIEDKTMIILDCVVVEVK